MPRRAKELSAAEVRRLPPGDHAVGGVAGLTLQHRPSGARSWILRIRIEGKRHELGLGPFPDVTLAMARDNARALADRVRRGEGKDVLKERQAARRAAKTVKEATEQWLEVKLLEIDGERNRKRYRAFMERHVYAKISWSATGWGSLTGRAGGRPSRMGSDRS